MLVVSLLRSSSKIVNSLRVIFCSFLLKLIFRETSARRRRRRTRNFVEYHAALVVVVVAAAVVDDDDVAAVAVVDVDAKQAAVKQVRMSHRVLANTAAKVRPLVQDRVGDPGSCGDVCAGSCDAVTMMSSSPQLR